MLMQEAPPDTLTFDQGKEVVRLLAGREVEVAFRDYATLGAGTLRGYVEEVTIDSTAMELHSDGWRFTVEDTFDLCEVREGVITFGYAADEPDVEVSISLVK